MNEYLYIGDEDYFYPNASVLKNKLGITDEKALETAERKITSMKLFMLRMDKFAGNFDFEHLSYIHKFIFGDIYEWAGNLRTGEFFAKGSSVFCRGQFLKTYISEIFTKLSKEKYLCNLNKNEFIERTAYFMGEINALHPFREGNGRTLREFFRQLSENAGYELNFSKSKKDGLLNADISAFNGNYQPLIKILGSAVKGIG